MRQLNRLGLAAEVAENGTEALGLWRDNPYALVLTDVHMPEMDGFELTAEIRKAERDRGGRAPIVAVTANVLEGEADKCLAAGMDDYLGKPVELDDLRRTLARWIDLPKAEPTVSSGPASPRIGPTQEKWRRPTPFALLLPRI